MKSAARRIEWACPCSRRLKGARIGYFNLIKMYPKKIDLSVPERKLSDFDPDDIISDAERVFDILKKTASVELQIVFIHGFGREGLDWIDQLKEAGQLFAAEALRVAILNSAIVVDLEDAHIRFPRIRRLIAQVRVNLGDLKDPVQPN